jgi:hypothetical protein
VESCAQHDPPAVVVTYDCASDFSHLHALSTIRQVLVVGGFTTSQALVTRLVTHEAEGFLAGAATGLGIGSPRNDLVGFAIFAGATALGSVAGLLLQREERILAARYDHYRGWLEIPLLPGSDAESAGTSRDPSHSVIV